MSLRVRPVLLAAGRSSRFEGGHKLLETLAGEPVIVRSARALVDAGLGRPTVITGSRGGIIKALLAEAFGDALDVVPNPDHASGMATSLALGARLVPGGSALLVALADMPLLAPGDHRAVAAALDPADPASVARGAAREGSRKGGGHPVAFGPAWPSRLGVLKGDGGAAPLLRGVEIIEVPLRPETQMDVDTRQALERVREIVGKGER